MTDISRSRRAEAKVTYMAHYDVLANLPNRSLFNTTLRRAFDRRDDAQILGYSMSILIISRRSMILIATPTAMLFWLRPPAG